MGWGTSGTVRRPARVIVLAVALAVALGALTGCRSEFAGLRLTIATGSSDGVYYQLGSELADSWATRLDITRPTVLKTPGGPANIDLLHTGGADIGFGSADAIDDVDAGPHRLRALARIYDDYIQVVVRDDLPTPIRHLSDLAGRQVSLGPVQSQVSLVANRILDAAGVHTEVPAALSLNDSITALRAHRIDAFFWSGGMPTKSIQALGRAMPIRVLDLGTDPSGAMRTVLDKYRVYGTAVVPAGTYQPHSDAVTTLVVPNYLLVTDAMPDDEANALVAGLFAATPQLVGVNSAAEAIDIHAAIYTGPVPLHPGAEEYYRSHKI